MHWKELLGGQAPPKDAFLQPCMMVSRQPLWWFCLMLIDLPARANFQSAGGQGGVAWPGGSMVHRLFSGEQETSEDQTCPW